MQDLGRRGLASSMLREALGTWELLHIMRIKGPRGAHAPAQPRGSRGLYYTIWPDRAHNSSDNPPL
eukprot:9719785-Lingulodinium_polyedra.AAC.1